MNKEMNKHHRRIVTEIRSRRQTDQSAVTSSEDNKEQCACIGSLRKDIIASKGRSIKNVIEFTH